MRAIQEWTGRRTVLWPKRTEREKKTRRRTVAERIRVKKNKRHQERACVDYCSKEPTVPCFSSGAYHRHVSHRCPLSQHCPGSKRCLWINLSPSLFLSLSLTHSLVPMQKWNDPRSSGPVPNLCRLRWTLD